MSIIPINSCVTNETSLSYRPTKEVFKRETNNKCSLNYKLSERFHDLTSV